VWPALASPTPAKQVDPAGSVDPSLAAILVAAIGSTMVNSSAAPGLLGSAPSVQLRLPALTLQAASQTLAAAVSSLPALLLSLLPARDHVKTEAGAATRAAEGVAAQQPTRTQAEATASVVAAVPATGADPDLGARSANAGVWIESSPFSHLLAMLRQILLQFEKLDRDNSANMVTLQRQMTVVAGALGVEAARERFGGAMAATMFTAAIGGFAMKRMNDSANVQTGSMATNQFKANKTSIQVSDARGQVKAHATPAENLRPARNIDGSPVSPRADGGRARADLQADTDVDVRSMKPSASGQTNGATESDRQRVNSENMANAQKIAAQGVLGNMVAAPVGNIGAATMEIESKFTESEQQLMALVAETFKRVADEQQDQAAKTRDMRDATAQLVESLMSLQASTSGDIIRHF